MATRDELHKVPPNWKPEDWGYHLGLIAFMEALGHSHLSFTDPVRHVRKFTLRLLEDERARIIEILHRRKASNADLELEIHRSTTDQCTCSEVKLHKGEQAQCPWCKSIVRENKKEKA